MQKNKWQLYEQTQSVITASGVYFTLLLECAEQDTMNCAWDFVAWYWHKPHNWYLYVQTVGVISDPPRQINNSN